MKFQFLLLLTPFLFNEEPRNNNLKEWYSRNYEKQNSVDSFFKNLQKSADTVLMYKTDLVFPRNTGIICWKKEKQLHGIFFETKSNGKTDFHIIDSFQKIISDFLNLYYSNEMRIGDSLSASKIEILPDYNVEIRSSQKNKEKSHKFKFSEITSDYAFIFNLAEMVYDIEDKIKD